MSNIIDKIQVSGVTYDIQGSGGGITIDPTLDSGSTNPVQNQALYDELRIVDESATLLEWEQYDGGQSINYPSGCIKAVITVDEEQMTYGAYSLIDSNSDNLGDFNIDSNNGTITVTIQSGNITYSINDNVVTVEYPTITNVYQIYTYYDNYWTWNVIGDSVVTPLIDQVTANTVSIQGKQDTLSAGTNITISGNVISAEGGGGNPTVELTQAEYDALVTAGTVSADTYYIITDAQAGDLTNYYTKTETDNAITAATSTKQDTLVSGTNIKTINNQSLLGSGNIDIQGGGGGKAIEAGRGIAITTGETADTVSFNLPISANTNNSIVMGGKINNSFTNNGRDCLMVGSEDTISNGSDCCLVVGYRCSADGDGSAVIGWDSKSTGDNSFAFGYNVTANTSFTFAAGRSSIANNNFETSFGSYNVSNTGSTNADKTLFSVGNGTNNARHNAFEIRQNGDIYLSSGGTDIKLQDYLGGGVDTGTVQTMIDNSITGKADTSSLATVATSGSYNDLTNKPTIPTVPTSNTAFTNDAGYLVANDITGKTDTSAFTSHTSDSSIHVTTAQTAAWDAKQNALTIDSTVTNGSTNPVQGGAVYTQLGGLKLVKLTQSAYDALSPDYDSNTLYVIVN